MKQLICLCVRLSGWSIYFRRQNGPLVRYPRHARLLQFSPADFAEAMQKELAYKQAKQAQKRKTTNDDAEESITLRVRPGNRPGRATRTHGMYSPMSKEESDQVRFLMDTCQVEDKISISTSPRCRHSLWQGPGMLCYLQTPTDDTCLNLACPCFTSLQCRFLNRLDLKSPSTASCVPLFASKHSCTRSKRVGTFHTP